ncbi:MAG: 1,4-dihydroxy-2-naphthoate polyprenyltransferase [Oceanipulchritudo sp.]
MKPFRYWVLAARPKTLPAAAVPVCVAGGLAESGGLFVFQPWLICLLFALLIQVGTNYANDYYDFIKGADTESRIGPRRAVSSGWISPGSMCRGMVTTFVAAFLLGCLLIPWGGWWLLPVGAVCILCGIAYTGGPYPLGYNGWGDVFVFLFFGWVATGVTFYVQAGDFSSRLPEGGGIGWTLLAGMVPGALATNLLVVNNVRDEPLDREAGKRTLAVRLGRRFALGEYMVLSVLSLGIPAWFAMGGGVTGCWLVLAAAPAAFHSCRHLVRARTREDYGRSLVHAALMLLLVGGLFVAGLVIGPLMGPMG